MGCGGSTAKPLADEPLAAVLPSGGTASARGGGGPAAQLALGSTPAAAGAAASSPAAAAAAAAPKKKALVIYDPLSAPFPPSAASLSRKVVGRAPLFRLDFAPEWRRAGEVVQALAMQRKQLMKAVAGMNAAATAAAAAAAAATATDAAQAAVDGEEKKDTVDSDSAATAAPAAVDADSVPAPAVFSSSTHEDNVVSGALGDAHVLAALVSVAAHPNRLARLFPSLDDPALAAVANQPAVGKNTHIGGLIVGSKLKSSALAKVYLAESGPKFAEEMRTNKYNVRLFYGGTWQVFTVDDCIPCTVPPTTTEDGRPVATGPAAPLPTPLFTHCRDSSEIWMILLEKALAKACGSYEDVCHATPVQLFRMLTGGSAETMVLPLPDKIGAAPTEDRVAEAKRLWSQVMTCWSRADMISASTRELTDRQHAAVANDRALKSTRASSSHGADESALHHFLHDHAELGIQAFFSVLDVVELPDSVGGARLMLLRNPQGSQHYDGRWSEGSAEWKALEDAQPDGPLHATRLRLSRKKHSAKSVHTHTASSITSAAAGSGSGSQPLPQQDSGIFWMEWSDVLLHFAALFTCAVLADQFDLCQTVQGEWKGKSAAGKPAELDAPASAAAGSSASASAAGLFNDFLRNPTLRIRNTGSKKSTALVITLSRGVGMVNAATSSLSAVNNPASSKSSLGLPLPHSVAPSFFGFKIVSNQLNHTLNANAPTASPIFGQIQLSPLHDELLSSPLSQDNSVSVSLPAGLAFGRDFYLVPFQFEAATAAGAPAGTGQGLEGDFVVHLWTNSPSLLFDAVPVLPDNPQVFPVSFSRREGNCGGNCWADTYLSNPTYRITSSAPPDAVVKLLCVLNKTRKADADVNVNMRLLTNVAPSTINTSAMGCVSAPAKPGGTAAGGKRGSVLASAGSAAASAIAASSSDEKREDAPQLHAAPKKSTYGKMTPVSGSLSPFHEGVEGACTRTGESSFYSADRSYAMVAQPIVAGREYYLVCSTFMPHTELEASLSLWGGAALEHVKVERVGREYHRQVEGRWVGTSAAGPARRKKTWLNNPQFCVRHHAPTPISIVITLTYTGPLGSGGAAGSLAHGAPGSEASVNISFCTFPVGSADPNPLSAAEKDAEKRKQKEEGKRSQALSDAAKRKLETERKASLQAQDRLVRGGDAPSVSGGGGGGGGAAASGAGAGSAAGGGLGVTSLRIKSKAGAKGAAGGKKDRHGGSGAQAQNMFGNLDADDAATAGADDASAAAAPLPSDSLPRVCPLTTDFELLSQSSFNGDLYRSGRCFHLFVPEVAPERSYFVVPSTAVPGMEGEFTIQVFGASAQAELRLDPCWLNTTTEATAMDMTALASRRMSAAVMASTTSHKAKKLGPGDGKKASGKKKH